MFLSTCDCHFRMYAGIKIKYSDIWPYYAWVSRIKAMLIQKNFYLVMLKNILTNNDRCSGFECH